MAVSQKCQYALRAVFELAKRYEQGPAKIGDVAAAQGIPPRFLEVILNELKQGGFTDSRRGKEGGYFLVRNPNTLTVGEIIRFIQGPIRPAEASDRNGTPGPDVFREVWHRAEHALSSVYDKTTMAVLIEEERRLLQTTGPDFAI